MERVEVVVERAEKTLLRLCGPVRPGWCGNLATGLASSGVGIRRGRGVKGEAGRWRAVLELDCPASVALTQEGVARWLDDAPASGFAEPIALTRHQLVRSERWDGCISLYVEGRDRVGFLAALLRRLAYFSLFPVELRLETIDGSACDRFFLKSAGGNEPRARTVRALAAMLEASCG